MDSRIISMIIPTLNAEADLPILLDALFEQTVPVDEIIVIDSSSDDSTVEIARSYDNVQVHIINRSDFNHGSTRHMAFMLAKGDLVCFMTQDAVPSDKKYIENLIRPLDEANVAMASGRQLPKANATRYEQLIREYNYPAQSHVRSLSDLSKYGIKTFFASDVCSVYKREYYLQCGGFPSCNTNEDMILAARLINRGKSVAYAADACVYHSHNLSFFDQYKRNKDISLFLTEFGSELCDQGEYAEGSRLFSYVITRLFQERQFGQIMSFMSDCVARVLGNQVGRHCRQSKDLTK